MRRLVSAFVAVLVTVAACGGDDDPTLSDSAATAQLTPAGFTGAMTIDGADFDASTVTGHDTVAWFWTPWCVICRGEAPDVAEAAERYADEVTFVGVAGLGPLADMQAFVEETSTGSFTHLADLDGAIWEEYGVLTQPAFAFIDEHGDVRAVTGGLSGRALTDRVDDLIAA